MAVRPSAWARACVSLVRAEFDARVEEAEEGEGEDRGEGDAHQQLDQGEAPLAVARRLTGPSTSAAGHRTALTTLPVLQVGLPPEKPTAM